MRALEELILHVFIPQILLSSSHEAHALLGLGLQGEQRTHHLCSGGARSLGRGGTNSKRTE